jgi:ankyrin repeat protein
VPLPHLQGAGWAPFAGADPNYRDPNSNKAPIHVAAEYASVEVVSVFISDRDGNTALHLVADQGLEGASEETVESGTYSVLSF